MVNCPRSPGQQRCRTASLSSAVSRCDYRSSTVSGLAGSSRSRAAHTRVFVLVVSRGRAVGTQNTTQKSPKKSRYPTNTRLYPVKEALLITGLIILLESNGFLHSPIAFPLFSPRLGADAGRRKDEDSGDGVNLAALMRERYSKLWASVRRGEGKPCAVRRGGLNRYSASRLFFSSLLRLGVFLLEGLRRRAMFWDSERSEKAGRGKIMVAMEVQLAFASGQVVW